MQSKRFILFASIFFFFILSFTKSVAADFNQPSGEGVIVHISSGYDNPQNVVTALTFARNISNKYYVIIFIDLAAVETVLNTSKSISFKGFEPAKNIINDLLQKGIKIVVCSLSLKAIGKTQYDLMAGLEVVEENDFFAFTSGRIISLDY